MKWSSKVGLVASALALSTGLAASTASAADSGPATRSQSVGPATVSRSVIPDDDTNITGHYFWNADGWTGTLYIYTQDEGVIYAQLNDDGKTEYLTGTWNEGTRTLTLTRPLPNGNGTQFYTYFLGGEVYNSYPAMFGGYFTATATGNLQIGTYLDSAF
jgi:hypothetical protein